MEVKIKTCNIANKVSDFLRQTGHVRNQIGCQYNFSGHIQTNHLNLFLTQSRMAFKGFIYHLCRIRVTPVIVFRYRGTIPMTFVAATHCHQFTQPIKARRIILNQSCNVCERTQGNDRYIFLFRQCLCKKLNSTFFGAHICHIRQKTFSKSICTMGICSVHIISHKRFCFPQIHGHIQPI